MVLINFSTMYLGLLFASGKAASQFLIILLENFIFLQCKIKRVTVKRLQPFPSKKTWCYSIGYSANIIMCISLSHLNTAINCKEYTTIASNCSILKIFGKKMK